MSAKQCECEVCEATSMPVCVALDLLGNKEHELDKANEELKKYRHIELSERIYRIYKCTKEYNDEEFCKDLSDVFSIDTSELLELLKKTYHKTVTALSWLEENGVTT